MNIPFFNTVLVCDAERTICGQIRNCSGIKIQTFRMHSNSTQNGRTRIYGSRCAIRRCSMMENCAPASE